MIGFADLVLSGVPPPYRLGAGDGSFDALMLSDGPPPPSGGGGEPELVHDLDGDGRAELLVYANMHEGALHVGFCSHPISSEYAGPYRDTLGPGQRSFGPGRMGGSRRPMWVLFVGALALGLLALALGLLGIWGRNKPRAQTCE
jgi:hypothetical protein